MSVFYNVKFYLANVHVPWTNQRSYEWNVQRAMMCVRGKQPCLRESAVREIANRTMLEIAMCRDMSKGDSK